MHSVNSSTAPIIFFSFEFDNSNNPHDANASIFFNMPNKIGGSYSATDGGFTLNRVAASSASPLDAMQTGNLSVTVVDAQEQERAAFGGDVVKPQVSFRAGVSLAENWAAFAKGSGRFPQGGDGAAAADDAAHGAVAVGAAVPARSKLTVTIALSWYMPNRLWGDTNLGHNYEHRFASSEDVAAVEGTAARLDEVLAAITAWHDACYNNTLPESVKDSLVNSAAVWGKVRDRWTECEHACDSFPMSLIECLQSDGLL